MTDNDSQHSTLDFGTEGDKSPVITGFRVSRNY